MPGGQKEAYELVAPILTKIAAVAEDGEPCVTYIGPDGAGHYVKMVHNGIEYGDMQLIAEAYSLLKGGLNLSNEELAETFTEWNKGELNSYLIDITKDIFTKKDEEGKYLVDVILDEAANKGTGKWTSQSSLDLGEPLSLITESVFARYISSLKEQRVAASKVLSGPQAKPAGDKAEFVEKVRRALYLGKIVSYAQGFSQLRAASDENNWDLNYGEIAKIFRAVASFVRSSCRKSPMLTLKMPVSRTCCWHRTSRKLLMNISRRCVTWLLTLYRTVSRFRPSLLQLPTTTAIVLQFCQLT
jgi:6-phosphogluconate dehydrogenase